MMNIHGVRKPPTKPWRRSETTKLPPQQKVYHVEPKEFRSLVQRLTGSGSSRAHLRRPAAVSTALPHRPLRETVHAPPPLDLVPRGKQLPTAQVTVEMSEVEHVVQFDQLHGNVVGSGGIGIFSPGWNSLLNSLPLLSPASALAALESSRSPIF